MDPKRVKLAAPSISRMETEQEDEEELLFDTPISLAAAVEEEPISVTKVTFVIVNDS